MLIDSHCHLGSEEFDQCLSDVMNRARSADVRYVLNAGGRFEDLNKQLQISAQYKNVYTVTGVHPHDASVYADVKISDVLKNTRFPAVVAIGECGLDYFYDFSPRDVQIKVFRKMIASAQESGLPLVVHTRQADADMCDILRQSMRQKSFSGVIHCYSSGWEVAQTALEIGFYISASGMITFKNSTALREAFVQIPLDRLLVETDAPYLAPVPFRGQINEPSFVVQTAKCLADIKNVDFQKISAITTKNFLKLFPKVNRKRARAVNG